MRLILPAALMLVAMPVLSDQPVTPADTIHPNIHQNNGPGSAACPGDQPQCGNMHGIANNPGQSGVRPGEDGVPGFASQLEQVHGGIGAVNRNASGDSERSGIAGGTERSDASDRGDRQAKVLLCHYEEMDVTPDADEATIEIVGELKNLPMKAAAKHLANHELDSVDLITWALDADGDGAYDPDTVTTACDQPGDGFVLIGEDTPVDDDDTPVEEPVVE